MPAGSACIPGLLGVYPDTCAAAQIRSRARHRTATARIVLEANVLTQRPSWHGLCIKDGRVSVHHHIPPVTAPSPVLGDAWQCYGGHRVLQHCRAACVYGDQPLWLVRGVHQLVVAACGCTMYRSLRLRVVGHMSTARSGQLCLDGSVLGAACEGTSM